MLSRPDSPAANLPPESPGESSASGPRRHSLPSCRRASRCCGLQAPNGIFWVPLPGSRTFILASVLTRPTDGQVSLFQIGGFGTTTVYWSSAEPGVDELTVPAQTHAHYNFGFTKPGYYELHVSGTGSGFPGQATGVLAFQVVPEPSASIAAVLAGLLAWAFLRSRHRHLTGRARLWPAA